MYGGEGKGEGEDFRHSCVYDSESDSLCRRQICKTNHQDEVKSELRLS